ncbi:MAG: hypothetical protein Q9173_004439 [Seirophora scorigena]
MAYTPDIPLLDERPRGREAEKKEVTGALSLSQPSPSLMNAKPALPSDGKLLDQDKQQAPRKKLLIRRNSLYKPTQASYRPVQGFDYTMDETKKSSWYYAMIESDNLGRSTNLTTSRSTADPVHQNPNTRPRSRSLTPNYFALDCIPSNALKLSNVAVLLHFELDTSDGIRVRITNIGADEEEDIILGFIG